MQSLSFMVWGDLDSEAKNLATGFHEARIAADV